MLEKDIAPNNLSTTVRLKDVVRYGNYANANVIKSTLKLLSKVSPKKSAKVALDIFLTPRKSMKARKRVHDIFKTAWKKEIKVAGKRVKTFRFGDGDKTIILVHGWEGRAWDFGSIIEPLIESGYKVVTFDGPAHGQSTGHKTNILEFTEVIQTLALEFSEIEALVGHSFGGAASLLSLERFEDLNVKKVITIGTPNKMKNVLGQFSNYMGLSEKVKEEMNNIILKKFKRDFTSISMEELFSVLDVDGMVIHDLDDRVVPFQSAVEVHERNPKLKLLETSELGHVRVLRDRQVHKEILDFLFESA